MPPKLRCPAAIPVIAPTVAPLQSVSSPPETAVRGEIAANREELGHNFQDNRAEITKSFTLFAENTNRLLEIAQQLRALASGNEEKFNALTANLRERLDGFEDRMEAAQQSTREELVKMQTTLAGATDQRLNAIRDTIDAKFKNIQEDNWPPPGGDAQDSRRETSGVGRKAFPRIVQEHQRTARPGAQGARRNASFAIKIPGRSDDAPAVLLPIDSKFPVEDTRGCLKPMTTPPPTS